MEKSINYLYKEYARMIEVCAETKFQDKPYYGVFRRENPDDHWKRLNVHPFFTENDIIGETILFAAAVVEDDFVFPGDTIYSTTNNVHYTVKESFRDSRVRIILENNYSGYESIYPISDIKTTFVKKGSDKGKSLEKLLKKEERLLIKLEKIRKSLSDTREKMGN